MNAVIYARYSSSSQREETIEVQIRECTKFAEQNGYTVLRCYTDKAISGTTDKRPDFQQMIKDSKQAEMERQAREKYISGEYTLGKLDIRGQRIDIRVTIPRKDGSGDVSFITGWMVLPNGKLKLNTPYGGK